jgi:hypothetical protein
MSNSKTNIEYKIKINYVDREARKNGDFFEKVEFIVTHNQRRAVNGFVIQLVEKTTEVKNADNTEYKTTSEISRFTSNNVLYSNDKYFEAFEIKRGKSVHLDSFQNGAITEYDAQGWPMVYDSVNDSEYDTYKTAGKISFRGTCVFLDKTTFHRLALSWSQDVDTPANGLHYLPYSAGVETTIFAAAQSPKEMHIVDITWDFANPKSHIVSNIIKPRSRTKSKTKTNANTKKKSRTRSKSK